MNKYLISHFGHPRGLIGRLTGRIMAKRNFERSKWAVDKLAVKPGDKILEIGFGPGRAIKLLSNSDCKFIAGIDNSEVILKMALRRNKSGIDNGKVTLLNSPAERIPFIENSFNKIFTINSHMFWDEFDVACGEIRRVLIPDGSFSIFWQIYDCPRKEEANYKVNKLCNQMISFGWEKLSSEVIEFNSAWLARLEFI